MANETNDTTVQNDEQLSHATENIRKYLTFISDGLCFGIDTSYVTEIIINHKITFLPMVPFYIKGIINLRGQIIPIVDMRLRMGKPPYESEDNSNCIIVMNIDSIMIGILVDAVHQVIDIDTSQISPPTANNQEILVCGMMKLSDGTTMLVLDQAALSQS